MIVPATVDIGLALFTQSELDAAVSAGAQYAASGSANVNSTNGASLATLIANIVTGASLDHSWRAGVCQQEGGVGRGFSWRRGRG